MPKLYYYPLLIISLLSLYGAVVYRLYKLNYAAIFLIIISTAITFILLNKAKKSNVEQKRSSLRHTLSTVHCSLLTILLIIIYCSLLTVNLIILIKSATTVSIISPWQAVPWYFFLTYTLATAILIFTFYFLRFTFYVLPLALIALHFLLTISVALVIYTIGFGFDPFIHQATEKLIAAQGSVDPKPFYYLGQYALIVILHKLTFIPIIWLDKLLVPVLTAIFLPYALFRAVKSLGADTRVALLSILFTLIFPFSAFIVTTPQNLANIFLLLIILLNITQSNLYLLRFAAILALATAAIHPLSGIPAILFVIFLYIGKHVKKKTFFTVYYSLITAITALALPVLLYINNKINPVINASATSDAASAWQLPSTLGWFSGTENFFLNLIYLYGFNIGIIITLFIISGIIIKIRANNGTIKQLNNGTIYFLMSLSLFVSYFITKFISFSYLISYEQSAFPNRILIIAVYFALPLVLLALAKSISAILKQNKIISCSLFLFFVLLITVSLYISYPRFDNYYNSRGYSISQSDINAARWVDKNSRGKDYVVLANQQISAAALQEFGFKKYFKIENDEIFYYPIPTGGRFYQYYLDMVYKKADKKTALEAAKLAGVNTVYFILNDYWWAFDKIMAEAKIEADQIKNIDNGRIYVFKYTR